MRISKYNLEMDIDGLNSLVKETSSNYPQLENVSSPLKIVQMCNDVFHLNKLSDEHCYLIALTSNCKPIGIFELSHGSINACICQTREIFARLLLCNCSQFVIVHNHPSGNAEPSEDDIRNYHKLCDAGKLMCLPCMDSIIIGGYEYCSLYEREKEVKEK